MRKILIIIPYFKPGYKAGGPIQSIFNMSVFLSKTYDINILTQNIDINSVIEYDVETDYWINMNGFKVKYLKPVNFNIYECEEIIKEINPEILYLNGLFSKITYTFLFKKIFKNYKSKIIVSPRGELDPGALNIKYLKKKIFLFVLKQLISEEIIFHATSSKEKNYIKNYFSNTIIVAHNIPKIIDIKPKREIKKKYITNLVFISRISPKKNLLYAIKILKGLVVDGSINFDVIGPIEDKQYWELIMKSAKKLPRNITFNYIGEIKNDELALKTTKYHYFLFPTKAENYGHVIYECLSYGIPVIISDRTPWNEISSSGVFVSNLNNINRFRGKIQKLHSLDQKAFEKISHNAYNYAKSKFNKKEYLLNYKKLFS